MGEDCRNWVLSVWWLRIGDFGALGKVEMVGRRGNDEEDDAHVGGGGFRVPRNKDRLMLRGLQFHGHHGVYEEERKLGQKFVVDVDAWADLEKAGTTDELEHTVSYVELYAQVKKVVEGPSFKLLESVVEAIAQGILVCHPTISDVRVKVCKPHVAVEGVLDYLGVEIFRSSVASADASARC